MIKKKGAATLIITVILLVLTTLIIIFASRFNVMQEQIVANQLRNSQAFSAAEAGLEFGIQYLQKNSATILANPVNGYIPVYSDANTSNVTLANNSKYTIVYSNPTAYNYKLIKITSTGTGDDGTATEVISQLVYEGSILATPPTLPVVSIGSVALTGNTDVINMETNHTINSGAGITFNGSSQTQTSQGSGHPGPGDTQNIATLSSMSISDFFASYFAATTSSVQGNVAHYYNNSSDTNYSSTLNGMTGTSIWIDQTGGTATISSTTTIGSAANPVLLIVNGSLTVTGSTTIYGLVVVLGESTITTTGNTKINGGFISTGHAVMSGNVTVTYSSAILSAVQSALPLWAKVPGTWKDF